MADEHVSAHECASAPQVCVCVCVRGPHCCVSMCVNELMKIYKWHLTISTQNNVCSQHQVPPQAKNTITLGQYNPQKLTPKTQTGNIGVHNVRYINC